MQIKIKNLTKRPVLLRLNSGKTLHIAPESTSSEIWEQDVRGNKKMEKLKNLNIVSEMEHIEKKEIQPLISKVEESPKRKKSTSLKKEVKNQMEKNQK